MPLSTRSPALALDAPRGCVALVGAGPGDPELLTLRALRRLEAADVVLHDNLISEDILALVPPAAALVNVGKRCGDPKDRGLQQREIHELMLAHSQRGMRVVRLKCGDPFVFGRGGEEVEFLVEHGVPTEVVPGITSALGAAASCQMPLTHRDYGANSVRFVVGQSQARELPDLDWAEMARSAGKQTVVFYMGMKLLDSICSRLLENKAPADTPMALVENATLPNQRVIRGTIASLPALGNEQFIGTGGPAIIFLGPIVAFPDRLDKISGDRIPDRLDKISGGRPWKCAKVAVVEEC